MTIKLLLAGALLMGTTISGDFKVEKVTPQELQELTTVRADFEKAQAKLTETETRIKEAHGQTKPSNMFNAGCIGGGTTVELRGEYALITSTAYSLCGGGVFSVK